MRIYTLDPVNKDPKRDSVFLAGPSYRPGQEVGKVWRLIASELLEKVQGFKGDIYIPEFNPVKEKPDDWTYSRQVSWEIEAMKTAKVILFWIPRDMDILPGLTTNIEFGEWMHSDKIVVGIPDGSDNNDYIKERCDRLDTSFSNDLEICVNLVVAKLLDRVYNVDRFFTADTHFGSARVMELSKRPFESVKDMDWTMAKNWNSTVSDNDVVYHLGDFGDPEIVKYLKGDIRLISGNYDTTEILKELTESGVTIMGDSHRIIVNGQILSLRHTPTKSEDAFTLFGHIHKLQMVKRYGLNVGVDCHDYTPIDEKTVLFFKNAILQHYDEYVFV